MADKMQRDTAVCPECGCELHLAHAKAGHLLLCPYCEEILYVAQTKPLKLDWAFEEPTQTDAYNLYPLKRWDHH